MGVNDQFCIHFDQLWEDVNAEWSRGFVCRMHVYPNRLIMGLQWEWEAFVDAWIDDIAGPLRWDWAGGKASDELVAELEPLVRHYVRRELLRIEEAIDSIRVARRKGKRGEL